MLLFYFCIPIKPNIAKPGVRKVPVDREWELWSLHAGHGGRIRHQVTNTNTNTTGLAGHGSFTKKTQKLNFKILMAIFPITFQYNKWYDCLGSLETRASRWWRSNLRGKTSSPWRLRAWSPPASSSKSLTNRHRIIHTFFQLQAWGAFWGDHWRWSKGELHLIKIHFLKRTNYDPCWIRWWARWGWWSRTRWCTRCSARTGARTACARGSSSGRRWSTFARLDETTVIMVAMLVLSSKCCNYDSWYSW